MSLKQQLLLFFASLGAGFLFGVFYDLYRVINRRFGFAPWFTLVGDLASWMLLGGAIFVMIQYTSTGEFRGVVLIGLGLGVLVYRYRFRRRVARLLWIMVNATARVIGFIWQGVSWPFRLTFKLVDLLLMRRLRRLGRWVWKQKFRFGHKIS